MAANVRASVCGFRRPSMENRIIFPQNVDDGGGVSCVRACSFGIVVLVVIGSLVLFTSWLSMLEGGGTLNLPAALLFFAGAATCALYVFYKECSNCQKKSAAQMPSV